MRFLRDALITVVVLVVVVGVGAYSRMRAGGLSADADPGPLERTVARRLLRFSISPEAERQKNPFGEDATAAGTIAAEPLADAELEAHAVVRPRQISQRPCVPAMDTSRWESTQRTGHAGLRRAHQQGDLCCRRIDVTGGKVERGRIG